MEQNETSTHMKCVGVLRRIKLFTQVFCGGSGLCTLLSAIDSSTIIRVATGDDQVLQDVSCSMIHQIAFRQTEGLGKYCVTFDLLLLPGLSA